MRRMPRGAARPATDTRRLQPSRTCEHHERRERADIPASTLRSSAPSSSQERPLALTHRRHNMSKKARKAPAADEQAEPAPVPHFDAKRHTKTTWRFTDVTVTLPGEPE